MYIASVVKSYVAHSSVAGSSGSTYVCNGIFRRYFAVTIFQLFLLFVSFLLIGSVVICFVIILVLVVLVIIDLSHN